MGSVGVLFRRTNVCVTCAAEFVENFHISLCEMEGRSDLGLHFNMPRPRYCPSCVKKKSDPWSSERLLEEMDQ